MPIYGAALPFLMIQRVTEIHVSYPNEESVADFGPQIDFDAYSYQNEGLGNQRLLPSRLCLLCFLQSLHVVILLTLLLLSIEALGTMFLRFYSWPTILWLILLIDAPVTKFRRREGRGCILRW